VAGALLALFACATRSRAPASLPLADTGFVAVPGGRLYYESIGNGQTVVLLHGGNLDRRMWDAQLPMLTPHFRVIRYDARGFGRSAPADTTFQAKSDLYALLEHLAVRRASLVGLSLGGRIAIDFVLEHPDMVDKLVLAGPGLSGWRDWSGEDTTWLGRARRAGNAGDSVGMALAWLTSDYMRPAMQLPSVAKQLRTLTADNARYWMVLFRHGDLEREVAPPALSRLSAIRAPTLLVVGDHDTRAIRQIVNTLASSIPGAAVVVLREAGHMVNMERPREFNRVLMDFLRP
jgi:pimeloyl-ACP methyl ester carboxylesterase